METLKFALFSDFHYKEDMYLGSVADIERILERAKENDVDFIIHCGDFCNDYIGSPELTNAYLSNKHNIPAYGVYGNHELESPNNSVNFVTPKLTNRKVVWGTVDGNISADGSVGYYYFDIKGYRVICTDTNYSYNPAKEQWEHNYTCSYGAPNENNYENSLGPQQLLWLASTMYDAAEKGLSCIVFSHAAFYGDWGPSPDYERVQEIYREVNSIRPKTVIASISGHNHKDGSSVKDNVFYMQVNAVLCGEWVRERGKEHHHTAGQTYKFVPYDENGKPLSEPYDREIREIWHPMCKSNYFYEKPLNAIVTVSSKREITVDGSESGWLYGMKPFEDSPETERITSQNIVLE